ncbi:beta-ketoacyl synthase chain length factor [Roseateles sp. L2-2]|uniref:beta-ketoacyl synthase chain length factor n=1 Tax=Roseateles sp. L2-2 TaxID=3422597 RepID=UPI003D35D60E
MTHRFRVVRWAAWAPGLASRDAWRVWLASPAPLAAEGQPPLSEVPAMMRRRIDPLGRAALQAAWWAQGTPEEGAGAMPVIFASRWGEIARSLTLLQQLAGGEPLSPTHFSLSVHNASGALYSMARQDRQNYLAVAGGEHSAEAAFCEALGLLADGAPQVLVAHVDAPLPEAYAALGQIEPSTADPALIAWACVLAPADDSAPSFALETMAADRLTPGTPSSPWLSGSLPVLALLAAADAPDSAAGAASLDRLIDGQPGGWRWSRLPARPALPADTP